MAQQKMVTMPDGSIYEFDPFDFQYKCTHENVKYVEGEVNFILEGEAATYRSHCFECANPECQIQLDLEGNEV